MTTINLTSYGTGHQDDPSAVDPVVVDTASLRNPPDDPAVRARLTRKTGLDREVAHYVMTTPGAQQLAEKALLEIWDRIAKGQDQVDVHVSCFGGRHRSVAVAEELAHRIRTLTPADGDVEVVHRHIHRPILPSRNAS